MMDYEEIIRNAPEPTDTEDDDLFYADALLGRIMGYLAAFGCFCAFLALCFFIGYFK